MEVKIEQLLEICDDNEIRTKFIHWDNILKEIQLSEEFIEKVAISVSQKLSKEFMIEFGNKLSCNDLIIYQKNIDEDVIKIIGKNFDIKNDSDMNMMESFIKIYHSIPNLHELLVNIKNNGRR